MQCAKAFVVSVLLVCVFSVVCRSQEEHDCRPFVFINILPLINTDNGSSYRGGLESPMFHNLSLCFEAGGYFPNKSTDVKGYQLRPSLKYYIANLSVRERLYLQGEFMYKVKQYNTHDLIDLNGTRFDKKYRVGRRDACIHIKIGAKHVYRRLVYDFYGGLGIRFIHAMNTLTPMERDGLYRPDAGEDFFRFAPKSEVGYWLEPNITAGIKFGLAFWKKRARVVSQKIPG